MKRVASLLSVLLLALASIVVGGSLGANPAAAAPLPAPYAADAQSSVLGVGLTVAALDLAGVNLANSQAKTDTAASPQVNSSSRNLGVAVAGLPITVVANQRSAPPQLAPLDGALLAVNALGIGVGAMTTHNDARYTSNNSCVTGTLLSDAVNQTAGATVTPAGLANLLTLGVSSVHNTNSLIATSGLNRATQSASTGTISGLNLLNDAVQVGVQGDATLTATANGQTGGATITHQAPTVTVTGPGIGTVTLTAALPSVTVTVPLVGSTTITLHPNPTITTQAADGTAIAATWSFLSVDIDLLLNAASAIVDLTPMAVSATAPVGGIDCPPPAPVITSPADGSTTSATPTYSGTAEPNATVDVLVDGTPVGTATADGTGAWTTTPTTPLAGGAHAVTATQTIAGATSPESAPNNFTVDATAPPAPVITTPANGSTTNDTTPAFSGTAEPSSTLSLTIDSAATPISVPVNAAGDWTYTPATPLAEGPHTAVATATDAVGNVSPPSNTVAFTIDATAPAAPVIQVPAQNLTTTDTTPTISGTADPNTTVTVLLNGNPVGTASADGAGAWSMLPGTPLADGPYAATATAADAAGNVSPVSNTRDFTVDTAAPAAPVITVPVDGSSTNDTTPDISGTAEANSTVTVSVEDEVIGTADVDGTGNWTLTPTTPLAPGSHTATATATDLAGNISPVSNEVGFTVDTTAPVAPVITAPADGSTTTDPTPPISGTAEPLSTVTVTVDGTVIGTADADGAGNWTLTPTAPLPDGEHTATATATDAAGNVSPASAPVTFSTDASAPAAPVITAPADGSSTNDTTPDITGSAEANSTVTVSVDGTVIGTVDADGAGAWTLTPTTPLAPGPHTASATATDAAGNVSVPSAPVSFTVDTTAPPAPVITAPVDGSSTNDTTPDITGSAEANSTVTVSIDGAVVGTAAADGAGAWTFTPTTPLAEGPHTATATAADAAGNVSPVSNAVTFTVDTTAPAAPVITAPADGSSTNDTTPDVTGTAEPGSIVTVTIDSAVAGTAIADPSGNWTFTPATNLTEGPHTASATATDAAGNVSVPSAPVTFTVDTTAPAAPVITAPVDGSSTSDTTPDVIGTAEANSTVTVTIDAVVAGIANADGTGAWTFTPATDLADGEHTATATATDAAGNVSVPSAPVSFTVDTIAPGAPVITAPANGSSTNDTTPDVIGTAEANSTVTVSIDGAVVGTAPADGTGAWTFTPTTELAAGEHTASATAADAAGNVSGVSNTVSFTIDLSAPAAPVITSPTDGATTDDTTPDISGTAEPGSEVEVFIDGYPIGTVTADDQGGWTLTVPEPLPDGDYEISATATDPAGNSSDPSDPVMFTVVAPAPGAPVIIGPPENSVHTGPDVVVTGTGDAGAILLMMDQTGRIYGPVTVSGGSAVAKVVSATAPKLLTNSGFQSGAALAATAVARGTWSLKMTGLADGRYTVSAVEFDAQGAMSPESNFRSFIVDSAAPTAPAITKPTDGSVIDDNSPTVSGVGEPGSMVTVTDQDGKTYGPATVKPDGSWSMPITGPLPDGVYTLTATQTDRAGNSSAASDPVTFTIDTTAPDAPVITTPAPGSGSADTTPTIGGTAEPGSTVTVSIDGDVVGTTVTDPQGHWSFVPTEPLGVGTHRVTATATDAMGHRSPVSSVVEFTVNGQSDGSGTGDSDNGNSGTGNSGNGNGGLAHTGAPLLGLGLTGLLLLLGGALLIRRSRRAGGSAPDAVQLR
ncbi:Ig-like domain-containing protein [Nakamurella lactea]|uniref:Ig-like domain-containing protein n=1 Tax=Nakamurella lactea TaxID=459515 RepID=UPI00040B2787|nr:Ig-like domain-containing protein [Nakamurella lactea]